MFKLIMLETNHIHLILNLELLLITKVFQNNKDKILYFYIFF